MAIVTATITVDFTANYAGDHRVCFRIQGSGDPYDCTTIVNCVGGGTSCQAIINTDVNTTSCDGVITFEGYVQAACEDEASLTGRLAWTADFTPNPICNRVELECAFGEISSLTITDGGQEYLVSDTVVITRDVADTQTTDAVISINTVGNGVINSISSLLAAGSGYLVTDVINIVDAGGTGSGASITVDSVGGSGEILTYTLTTNGSDYIGPFTFTGGAGLGADFDIQSGGVDYDVFGTILSFTITNGGLYDIAPDISITTATGSGEKISAVIADCPVWNSIGLDCTGATVNLASGLPHTQTVAICLDDSLYAGKPAEYTATETGCCIPADTEVDPNNTCLDYHIENTSGAPINIQYTACNGVDTTLSIGAGVTEAVCAVNNGIVDLDNPDLVITNTGNPCT